MKPKRWQVSNTEHYDISDLSRPLTSVLRNRGFHALEDMKAFLEIAWHQLESPFLLPDLYKAVDRIEAAIAAREPIWIYGDYDVDGMTSTAIVYRALAHLGADVHFYIPRRLEEGYGLNSEAIDFLHKSGAKVIITVDCGISALEQAQLALELGVDLIITDHHECQEELPRAYALVNPKVPGANYPFEMLAGAGIALKLAMALLGDRFDEIAMALVALSCVGTIADVAPLNGENRVIAGYGLTALTLLCADEKTAALYDLPQYYTENWQATEVLGLKALAQVCQLDKKAITAGHVGFMIGPRLNAVGRLEHAQAGVELLITDDFQEAMDIARRLDALNKERQDTEQTILNEALHKVGVDAIHLSTGTIVVWGKDWHTGVVGIVASRLVERFYRPVIVLSETDSLYKGSARSIAGYSIFEALLAQKQWLTKFGGHEQAAGLTFPKENLAAVLEGIKAYNKDHLHPDLLVENLHCEARLTSKDISHQLLTQLSQLEPYGMGNPKPTFRLDHLKVEDAKRLGKDQSHLKIMLNDHYRLFEALQFKYGDRPLPTKGHRIDVALQLDLNTFNGVESVQLLLKDFRSYHPQASAFNQRVYVEYIMGLFSWLQSGPFKNQSEIQYDPTQFYPNERSAEALSTWISCEEPLAIWSYEGLLEYVFTQHDLGRDGLEAIREVALCPKEMAFGTIAMDLPLCPIGDSLAQEVTYRRLDHLATETIAQEMVFDRNFAAELFNHLKKEIHLSLSTYLITQPSPAKAMLTLVFFEEAGFVTRLKGDYQLAKGPFKKFTFEESELAKQVEAFKQVVTGLSHYMKQQREI